MSTSKMGGTIGMLVLAAWVGGLGVCSAQVWDVPQKYQEKDNWCWAGCMQSILAFYGYTFTQTAIAQYGTGGVDTWNYCYGSGTEGGVFRRGFDLMLNYFASIQTVNYSSSVPLNTVQGEMAAARPVVINWYWDSGGGHFVVPRGLSGNTAYVMDPYYGPTINTFAWTQQGGGHTWSYSVRLTTSPGWDAGYTDLGGGWRRLGWFGDYVPMGGEGWIWHNKHGFLYVAANSTPSGVWFYCNDRGWLWTSATVYPYIYRSSPAAWLWYNGSSHPRWFRNMTTGQWESWP